MSPSESTERTQIDSFHLFPLRSMTLTLKSTPIVAVRATKVPLKHQHSPISECSNAREQAPDAGVRSRHAPEVSSGERNVSSVNRSSKEDFPTLDAPVSTRTRFCYQSLRRRVFIESRRRCGALGFPCPPPDPDMAGYTRDCTVQSLDCSSPLSRCRGEAACRPTRALVR